MRKELMAALMVGGAALAGCGPALDNYVDEAVDVELMAPPGGAAAAGPDAAADAPRSARTGDDTSAPSIAYAYRFGLELPTEAAPRLMFRHEQACISAGPTQCQVLGAQSNRVGRDSLSARLEMRASPAYVARFRAGLEKEAKSAGGSVIDQAVESEDLTRQLIDTEARLKALTTLRDRLQQLLSTRSGTLEQLLQVERELARVQGELDAARSTLEVMRTRVQTSRLDVYYRAAGRLVPDSALRPVSDAMNSATYAFMSSLGGVILFVAGALPVLLLGAPLLWLIWRWRRQVRARKAAAQAALTKEAEASPSA